jgi:hypothetical protein
MMMKGPHKSSKEVFPGWLEADKLSYDIVPYTKSEVEKISTTTISCMNKCSRVVL